MLSTLLGVSRNTHDMVTGNGNNSTTNSSGESNPFRTPANPRVRDATEFALGARTPQGSVTFMQHYQNRRLSEPARSPQWRDFLSEMPTTNIFNRANPQDVDPLAPAPIEGHSSIRRSDIYKLPQKVNSFDGHWDKFSTTFDLYPNLHTIHTCRSFRLPYPQAVETESPSITNIIMSYSTMGDC